MSNSSDTQQPQTDAEWKEVLSAEEYEILREAGTEPRGSSPLLEISDDGVFRCAGCGQTLFPRDRKCG